MSITEFNDIHGNKFGVSVSKVRPLHNSLYPGIVFELILTHMQNGPFHVSNPIGHVRIVSGEGNKRFAGDLYFQFNAGELSTGKETMGTSAHLVLDPFKISQIEKIRANKDIKMILNLQFTIVKRDRQTIRYSSTTGGARARVEINGKDNKGEPKEEKGIPGFQNESIIFGIAIVILLLCWMRRRT